MRYICIYLFLCILRKHTIREGNNCLLLGGNIDFFSKYMFLLKTRSNELTHNFNGMYMSTK